MIYVYSISLGCPKNRVDTEQLLGSIPGVTPVDTVQDATCVLINTCGFMAPAIQESVRAILDVARELEALPAAKRPLLAVAGCLVGRYGKECLAPDLPEVQLWLDNRELASWPGLLAKALGLPEPAAEAGRLLSTGPSYAWLKISDGCDHKCSFCTIPAIRGAFHSTPAPVLVREAKNLLAQGVKELVLVAQDTTAWGRDLGVKHGLQHLLEQLLPLDGLARLRIMYLYPAGLTRELLAFLQQAGPPFVPYFDVPLQHAHSEILSRMGRPFARNPREVVERIRDFFPQASLRTSLIVGFPGETEEHFETLRDFVLESRFQHMGVFAFQAEEGTKAGAMPGQVEDKVKEWRRDSLMMVQGEISEELLEQYVGQRLPILVDAPHPEWPGLHTGRAWFQAPESDGVTYISGPGVTPGALVDADITEAQTYDLVALA